MKAQQFERNIQTYRGRMHVVGQCLNQAMQRIFNEKDAYDAVGRAAYAGILSAVFDALFAQTENIPTDELIKLSRIVAEQRRAELAACNLDKAAMPKPRGNDGEAFDDVGPSRGCRLPPEERRRKLGMHGEELWGAQYSTESTPIEPPKDQTEPAACP